MKNQSKQEMFVDGSTPEKRKAIIEFLESVGEKVGFYTKKNCNDAKNAKTCESIYFYDNVWAGFQETPNCTLEDLKAYFGKSTPKKVWVSDNENAKKEYWKHRYFVSDLGSQFIERFICVYEPNEEKYLNSENNISTTGWNFMLTEEEYNTRFNSRLSEIEAEIARLEKEKEEILKGK